MTLNKNGNNDDIKFHILPDEEMKKLGFHLQKGTDWIMYRPLKLEISLYVVIKNESDWRIDVIDDDFGQPYDYQYLLEKCENPYAREVKNKVDGYMQKFLNAGLISGWKVGDYV